MRELLIAALLPVLFWTAGIETAPQLRAAGIKQIAVPPEQLGAWQSAGFQAEAMTQPQLESLRKLLPPGLAPRTRDASPTRAPWVDANGWRLARWPKERFYYTLPRGRAALAAAEVFAWNANAVMTMDPGDLEPFGQMLGFLGRMESRDLAPVADFGVIDDGTPLIEEVMNLLNRRNLLFRPLQTAAPQFRMNIRLGTKLWPKTAAEDPSAFALKVRRQLGDEQRSLRLYGSEVVIARLLTNGRQARVILLNYSGRTHEGLRVRVRGQFGRGTVAADRVEAQELQDFITEAGTVEFTIPKMQTVAVVDLLAGK
ncbi:MAG: hypothetical protein ACKV2V_22305 [Blastocatellia bacterium]